MEINPFKAAVSKFIWDGFFVRQFAQRPRTGASVPADIHIIFIG